MTHTCTISILTAALLFTTPAFSQHRHSRKVQIPAEQAAGPCAECQDFGNVAVLVDNGLMIWPQNPFDLEGVTVRFEPSGTNLYTVSTSTAALDPDIGPTLTFGFAGATLFPGDDDSQQIAFPAGFPFFGTTYASVWVNTDGNVTFGVPEFASSDRDKARHALGPPRISAFLHDWNAFNALNPAGSGTIHAAVKTNPDRLVASWVDVADFEGGVASTFQLTLYSSGIAEITFVHLDPASIYGVVGIAEGGGRGPIQIVDYSSTGSPQALQAGAVMEAFARFTQVSEQEVAREFYRTHADKFDFLVTFTDFPVDGFFYHVGVSNQTHGIGNPSLFEGFTNRDTVFDFSAAYGSSGELESILFMNNIFLGWPDAGRLLNPPIEPYRPGANVVTDPASFGSPVTLDGQTMSQIRYGGTLPPDGGETSRFFPRGGIASGWLFSAMAAIAHETEHRWGVRVLFVHPTKGTGFESFDLLGRETGHWSYFVNSAVPNAQFPDAPRSSALEGNVITDLGALTSYNGTPVQLDPGESVFEIPSNHLVDGYSELDQYLMGLRRADEVGPFFYVDEPKSIYTGQSLDELDPENPLNTFVTMRAWNPQAGIVFKGKRVDLTLRNIMDFEKARERGDNPQGSRFWGPRQRLTVRYFSDSRRVDPQGDASVVLSTADRQLGDEADRIELDGKPTDVKTMAFILLVRSGPPWAHVDAVSRVDTLRRTWHAYGNGPAAGGRGRFDTSLDPLVY